MKRIFPFLPTVVIVAYMTIGHTTHFRLDLMSAVTVLLLLIIVPSVLALVRWNMASAIDKAMALFIALAAAGFVFWPTGLGRLAADFPEALLYGVLFLSVAGPMLFGREPFTTHFARKRVPQAVWETDIFKRINLNMTWAWAGIFGACAVSALIPTFALSPENGLGQIVFKVGVPMVLLLGVGIPFTKYYPDYYQRRLGIEPVRAPETESRPEPPIPGPLERPAQKEFVGKEENVRNNPKVVAINGSPHEGVGNTSLMIGMLEEHLNKEGFELEHIMLSRHLINYCTGCALCLEKGTCWIKDDHKALAAKVLDADALILASPVYFHHVTAQMKTFLDRSLSFGHKPRPTWKPGLAVSVSAGWGETDTARYLGGVLRAFGAFNVGELTSIAVGPGEFIGKEAVEARAKDLARDLVLAVREGRRYPATCDDLEFWQFMGKLVHDHPELMKSDHEHWKEHGLYESFEAYVGQTQSTGTRTPEMRRAWLKDLMKRHAQTRRETRETASTPPVGPDSAKSVRDLLEMMPKGLDPEAAAGLEVTYQFKVTDGEDFTAHLTIQDQRAVFHEGPASAPQVTITTPAEVWLAIAQGRLEGAQAFMSGKYKAEGDMALLMKLNTLFPR